MFMVRSSSMPRLLPSPVGKLNREDSVLWGNDSCAQFKMNFSLVPMSENEEAIVALVKEIKHAIEEQSKRKSSVERQMSLDFKLAKARLNSGSRMGAVLSMRRAHKNKAMKAYIAAARFRLISLRKVAESALRDGDYNLNVAEQRSEMNTILAELTVAKCPMPSNDDLLKQLQRSIMVETS